LAAAHISSVNCDEMPKDRPKNLPMNFFCIKYKF